MQEQQHWVLAVFAANRDPLLKAADLDIVRFVDSVWSGDPHSCACCGCVRTSAQGASFWNSSASDRPEGASCAFNEASAVPQMNTRAAVARNVMEGLYELISRTVRRE